MTRRADRGRSRPTFTYAIGDIHGRLDLLEALLRIVEEDAGSGEAAARIVFTGDYLDRGAHSHGVVERLMTGPGRSQDRFICLRGNHDDLFVKAVEGGHTIPPWAEELHRHTFVSYGALPMPEAESDARLRRHAAFLSSLPLTFDDGHNLFVHAGIRPGVPIANQSEHDLLWIREEFLTYDRLLPRRIVHGHTIMGDHPIVTVNRVSIDTGAYRSGILTAAVFDGGPLRFLQAVGPSDRGAIVREILLSAMIDERPVTQSMHNVFDDFVAERIDLPDLETRLRDVLRRA